jgi:hypothetical protein
MDWNRKFTEEEQKRADEFMAGLTLAGLFSIVLLGAALSDHKPAEKPKPDASDTEALVDNVSPAPPRLPSP